MTFLKGGTYKFDDNYKLVKDWYVPAKRVEDNKKKKKIKINKYTAINIVIIIIFILILLAVIDFKIPNKDSFKDDGTSITTGQTNIILPEFSEEVQLSSKLAGQLYAGEISVSEAITGGNPYRSFVFEYKLKDKDGLLILSEHPDYSDSKDIVLFKDQTSVSIDNLKTNQQYYYMVHVGEDSYTGQFKTAEGTRYIYMPGVYNTRDIGGYKTLDGKTVKQGMIIRGTEIDGLVEPTYYLEEYAVKSVMEDFGFVCDFDLRAEGIYYGNYESRLGKNVKHSFYTSPQYGGIFNVAYKNSLKKIFTELAVKENYPMYLHCTYGADRTGTIVYLLQGILNMSEKDMIREYQMTGFFSTNFATSDYMNVVSKNLNNFSGNTIQEKIESFLIGEIGITKDQIQAIKNILLEN